MSPWGWKSVPSQGIWRQGPLWLRPFAVTAPWLTLGLLMAMLWALSGTLTVSEGVLFDLPEAEVSDAEPTKLVALVMPMPHDTLVFFDDARYSAGDEVSMAAFGDHLADRLAHSDPKTLLLMADRRVPGGEIMEIAARVRQSGAKRVLVATRRPTPTGE